MRETLQPSQRTCHLRFSLVQLAHFLRVQLWLYADRRFSAALREEQDVDGHRAYLQRYLLLYHKLLHTYYHYYYNHHPSKLAQEWAINACIAYTQSTHFQGLFFFFSLQRKPLCGVHARSPPLFGGPLSCQCSLSFAEINCGSPGILPNGWLEGTRTTLHAVSLIYQIKKRRQNGK